MQREKDLSFMRQLQRNRGKNDISIIMKRYDQEIKDFMDKQSNERNQIEKKWDIEKREIYKLGGEKEEIRERIRNIQRKRRQFCERQNIEFMKKGQQLRSISKKESSKTFQETRNRHQQDKEENILMKKLQEQGDLDESLMINYQKLYEKNERFIRSQHIYFREIQEFLDKKFYEKDQMRKKWSKEKAEIYKLGGEKEEIQEKIRQIQKEEEQFFQRQSIESLPLPS